MSVENAFKVSQIQHLGIVAGMCNEIGLIKTIDRFIPKPKRKVSLGRSVQAMILNGLGFTGRALYLTPEFFRNRPVETLIGEGLTAEDLHDDCMGTALDALYEYGITELFYHVAANALKTQGIDYRFVHLDSTTFSFHGDYPDKEEDDPSMVSITKGFSKDRAPDLNQVVTSLMCSYRSTIPVWLEVLSGNASDKATFKESIRRYRKQFQQKRLPYFVADSALYTKNTLTELDGVKWVTRVPETIKEAKQAIMRLNKDAMTSCGDTNYRFLPYRSTYAEIEQRWIIVYSQKAYEREMQTFKKNLEKKTVLAEKELWHLSNRPFACEADALAAARKFEKTVKWHTVTYSATKKLSYDKRGRPAKDSDPTDETWFLTGELFIDEDAISAIEKRKGMFIVATNELDEAVLPEESLIEIYKAQGISVERGFRFLKDPMFYADSLYLNSPKRIMALIMVMGLSLLVYSLAERKVRNTLKEQGLSIPSQVKKPTDNPTIRWVFQIFEGIALLHFVESGITQGANMEERHRIVLQALGPPYEKIYFLH